MAISFWRSLIVAENLVGKRVPSKKGATQDPSWISGLSAKALGFWQDFGIRVLKTSGLCHQKLDPDTPAEL